MTDNFQYTDDFEHTDNFEYIEDFVNYCKTESKNRQLKQSEGKSLIGMHIDIARKAFPGSYFHTEDWCTCDYRPERAQVLLDNSGIITHFIGCY